MDALPATLVPFVTGVAAAIPCDPAAVALPALAVCGAAVGAARVLEIKRAWAEPPIIWAALVARSGSVKSPPFELAVEPLHRLDHDLRAIAAGHHAYAIGIAAGNVAADRNAIRRIAAAVFVAGHDADAIGVATIDRQFG